MKYLPEFQCRACSGEGAYRVLDLGLQPLANNLLQSDADVGEEPLFPLDLNVCSHCWLMQIGEIIPPVELFSNYLYFSSFSEHMLEHAADAAKQYVEEFDLDDRSFVVEVASNDGYLLKNFKTEGVPCLGIEPAENIAKVAREVGIDTLCEFFGKDQAAELASDRGKADLILANNVFAHVPDPVDFSMGLKNLMKEGGRAVIEFPYGVDMLEKVEFDTIYHEHVYYFLLSPIVSLLEKVGLAVFKVKRISIHGGSLRIYIGHKGEAEIDESVTELLEFEQENEFLQREMYERFEEKVEKVREDLKTFIEAKVREGATLAGYGASAKGSTLLNYVGESSRDLEYLVDRSTYKQGKLSPGIHLPILDTAELTVRRPDYVVLLTWNFKDEILGQQKEFRDSDGKFVIPIPSLEVV